MHMPTNDQILNTYIKWIKDNTIIKRIESDRFVEISTPFLDRKNDHLEIYLIPTNVEGRWTLTDDGFTVAELKNEGLDLNTPKRIKALKEVLNGFGIKHNEVTDELYVETNRSTLGHKKNSLIQCILGVNDMFYLAQSNVSSFFKEDVELFLKTSNVLFIKDTKLSGKSGLDHPIDFIVPATPTLPEVLIKTINNPKRDSITSAIFAFEDIKGIRDSNAQNIVVMNDIEKDISNDALEALDKYDIVGKLWSEKEVFISELISA